MGCLPKDPKRWIRFAVLRCHSPRDPVKLEATNPGTSQDTRAYVVFIYIHTWICTTFMQYIVFRFWFGSPCTRTPFIDVAARSKRLSWLVLPLLDPPTRRACQLCAGRVRGEWFQGTSGREGREGRVEEDHVFAWGDRVSRSEQQCRSNGSVAWRVGTSRKEFAKISRLMLFKKNPTSSYDSYGNIRLHCAFLLHVKTDVYVHCSKSKLSVLSNKVRAKMKMVYVMVYLPKWWILWYIFQNVVCCGRFTKMVYTLVYLPKWWILWYVSTTLIGFWSGRHDPSIFSRFVRRAARPAPVPEARESGALKPFLSWGVHPILCGGGSYHDRSI